MQPAWLALAAGYAGFAGVGRCRRFLGAPGDDLAGGRGCEGWSRCRAGGSARGQLPSPGARWPEASTVAAGWSVLGGAGVAAGFSATRGVAGEG